MVHDLKFFYRIFQCRTAFPATLYPVFRNYRHMFFSRLQSEVQSATTVSSARQNSSQWYLKFPELLSFADHCVVCKAKLVSVLPLLFPLHVTKYMKPLKCVLRGSLIRMGHLIRGWHHHRNMRPPVITARRCGELARSALLAPGCCLLSAKYIIHKEPNTYISW